MSKVVKQIAVLALLGSVWTLGACGDAAESEEQAGSCEVPPGTYTIEFSDAGGDCPDDIVLAMTSRQVDEEIEPGEECGFYSQTYSETLDDGCDLTFDGEATGTADGIEDASFTVEVTCPDGSSCTHDFNAYYTKR